MNSNITAKINFLCDTNDGCPPWMDADPKLGFFLTNYVQIPTPVTIYDLRGKENTVTLDNNGFEFHKYNGDIRDVYDDSSPTQEHYKNEIANLLKNYLGASRVIIFNHIMRERGPPRPADQHDCHHKNPAFFPHVDNDPPSVRNRIKQILGEDEAEKVFQKRFQIINVWRPLGPNPIKNNPLALCDYRSIDPDIDMHISELRRSKVGDSIWIVSNHSQRQQKWYYWSNMRSNEMIILKIFDSNPDVAQFAAHTAFNNENIPETNIKQHSIEMRCLVLYDQ